MVCFSTTPQFPGGSDSLISFVKRNLKYPETAIKDSIEGKVIVTFFVGTTGKITDVKLKHGVRYDLDNEALRIVSIMPKWIPANVKVNFTLPIKFTLYDIK